jgi:hypothetical protein
MFYIDHNSDNFSIIDCCLSEDNEAIIAEEIETLAAAKGITRFISTHPDDDHIRGLKYLDSVTTILNFYCVRNKAQKEDQTDDFDHYCELRDSNKAFYLFKGCSRKWMNQGDGTRDPAGIGIHWPVTSGDAFRGALAVAEEGRCPNNISPIITYEVKDGATFMWMGDLDTDFIGEIKDSLNLPRANILFAPHHGRDSGKVPEDVLTTIDPDIIVVGEAASQHLHYYPGYNTITQNSAGDITFNCVGSKVCIFTSETDYAVDFLDDEGDGSQADYLGTLNVRQRLQSRRN